MPSPHDNAADAPELEAFLISALPSKRLQGPAMRAAVQSVWKEAEAPPVVGFSLATQPQRIMVMWRLCRQTAIIKGLTAEDETLEATTDVEPSPWNNKFMPILSASAESALRKNRAKLLLQYHAADGGLPLLPPARDAAAMYRWCAASSIVAADLGVERSAQGLAGLQGLLDPEAACYCDVNEGQIMAFEELMLSQCLDMLLDKGERASVRYLKDFFNFSHRESTGLMRVVKTQALSRSSATIEEKRALMEMRLEDHVGRSKDTMDMDGEMRALKELAKIQGLTRTQPEDQAAEFFAVVRRVSERQDQALMSPEDTVKLNRYRGENIEPETIEHRVLEPAPEDDEDAEALAEYDRENQHRS